MAKRIAYFSLTSDFYGGERMLLNLLSELDRNRFVPLVIAPANGRLTQELQDSGIEHLVRPLSDCDPVSAPLQLLVAMRFLKRHAIDLVHVNSSFYWRPMEILAARLLRIPVLTHAHVTIGLESPFLRYSSAIITNSRYTREASQGPRDRMRVVYNSVDLRIFDSARERRSELGFSNDEVTVLFIGQLKPIKGVELFIEMAGRLSSRKAKFIIAGDCRDENYLSILKTKAAGHSNIVFLGFRTDFADVFMSADVVVVPSQWDEPFGLVNIEAGACSKPVVGTRVGGIPEIIEHGENGFLVHRDDLDSLVMYTDLLIADAPLREQLGRNGRRIVETKFSNSVHAHRIQGIYDELLTAKRNDRRQHGTIA